MELLIRGTSNIQVSQQILLVPDYNNIVCMKYVPLEKAKSMSNQYIRTILDMIPIKGNHRHVFVDIKLHDMKVGQSPALNHWHIDSVSDLSGDKEEVHHLFVSDDVSLTEFIKEDLKIKMDDFLNRPFDKMLENIKYTTSTINPRRIYTYGRSLHRATPATRNGKRILIRVSEMDEYQAPVIGFKPTYSNGKHTTKNN